MIRPDYVMRDTFQGVFAQPDLHSETWLGPLSFCLGTKVPRHSAGSNCGRTSSKARVMKQHVDFDHPARGWGIAAC